MSLEKAFVAGNCLSVKKKWLRNEMGTYVLRSDEAFALVNRLKSFGNIEIWILQKLLPHVFNRLLDSKMDHPALPI